MATYSAFFYGTLMHPKVLQRVIGVGGKHLQIAPAVLLVSGLSVDLYHRLKLSYLGLYSSQSESEVLVLKVVDQPLKSPIRLVCRLPWSYTLHHRAREASWARPWSK